jgi:hypothetical protein
MAIIALKSDIIGLNGLFSLGPRRRTDWFLAGVAGTRRQSEGGMIAQPGWIGAESSVVVRMASQPVGLEEAMAAGMAWAMLSTARRVMQSNVSFRVSARPLWTFVCRPRVRTASRRKAAFLFWDSARVTAISGRIRAMGIPGKPAPEPKSSRVVISFGAGRGRRGWIPGSGGLGCLLRRGWR